MTWPSSRRAWTLTTLLTLAYVLSFVDRYILGLLIEPVKADLKLTDEQIGYLLGPAFALFYATMGVPLGWAADRVRRTWLVAAGIFVWSLATAASGLARSFARQTCPRMSVGVGEAVLSPSAMSLIGDSFPPEKRGRPVAVYSAALSLGAGLASLIGAGVLIWAKTSSGLTLPVVGAVAPWQFAFFAVGLPGFALAIAFLFVPEPPRMASAEKRAQATFGEAIGVIGRNFGAFGGVALLASVMTIIAYSHGFLPSGFARTFGWEPKDYALVSGIIVLTFSPAIVTSVGFIADRYRARIPDIGFRLLVIGFVIMLPTNVVPLFMPSGEWAFVMIVFANAGIGIVTGAGIIALLEIAPAHVRAQIVALYYMTISITGLGLGPTTVGILSTRVFGEAELRSAIAAVPIVFGAIPLLMIPLIRRAYLRQQARILAEAD